MYARLHGWGYEHKGVKHGRGEFARDEDGDGLCEVHVNTMEGFWSLLRSWLRPHRGISQEQLPVYLGFFEFVHNVRKRGKALLPALIALLVTSDPGIQYERSKIRKGEYQESGGSILWTINPNFAIRLAGNIAIPLGGYIDLAHLVNCDVPGGAGVYGASARCGGTDPALRGEVRFRARF